MLYSRTPRNTCVELALVAADLLSPNCTTPKPTTLRYRLVHIAARIATAPALTGRHLRREGLEGEHHKQVAGCLAALPDSEVDRARDVEVVGQHLEHCGLRCCVDVRLARGDP